MSEPTRDADEGCALALVPLAKEIADFVTARVPDGTHFGVLLFAPSPIAGEAGRIIALTSDRDAVAPLAAQWAVSVLTQQTGERT